MGPGEVTWVVDTDKCSDIEELQVSTSVASAVVNIVCRRGDLRWSWTDERRAAVAFPSLKLIIANMRSANISTKTPQEFPALCPSLLVWRFGCFV